MRRLSILLGLGLLGSCASNTLGSAAEPELTPQPRGAQLWAETPKVEVQLRNDCESPITLTVETKGLRSETRELNVGAKGSTSREFKSGDVVSLAPAQSVRIDIRTTTLVVPTTCDALVSL